MPAHACSPDVKSVPPQLGYEAVHELLPLREIAITQTKEMMTADHDPPTRPAFE